MSAVGPPQGAHSAPTGGSEAAKPRAWGEHTRRRRAYGFALSFQDMLMAMIAVYAFLFLVAFALIKPADQKPGVEMKAEYLLTLDWPDGNLDDIDLHLLLPDQRTVNFRNREVEHAMLDHDDLGTNGVYSGAGGERMRIRTHEEVITLRAIVPGTYVANVHVYRVNGDTTDWRSDPKLPFPVKVRLVKLNPRVEELAVADVVLSHVGEQKTAFQFTIAQSGSVTIDRDADVPFIPTAPNLAAS
jgi:hypothetical protein